MSKKDEKRVTGSENAFMRWLHKGRIFNAMTKIAQVTAQSIIVLVSIGFCIEYLIPAVSALYAQNMYITPELDKVSLLVLWGFPMLFMVGIVLLGEWALICATWRLLGKWFSQLRDNRAAELEKRFSEVS